MAYEMQKRSSASGRFNGHSFHRQALSTICAQNHYVKIKPRGQEVIDHG